jgi:hypothetical protein
MGEQTGDRRVATWKSRQETVDRSEKKGKQTGDWERKNEIRAENPRGLKGQCHEIFDFWFFS